MATSTVPEAQQDGEKKLDQQRSPTTVKHEDVPQTKLEGEELMEAIRKQVEYYFSRENLVQDAYLVSKMDKEHYVDVSVIADFKLVKALTIDENQILQAVKTSTKVTVDEAHRKIRPTVVNARTTLILRNIPSSAPEEKVVAFLAEAKVPTIVSIRADVGDNWFVTFESEDSTKSALELVKPLKYAGKSIGCAIKSESLLKGITPGSPPKGTLNVSSSGTPYFGVPMQYNPNGTAPYTGGYAQYNAQGGDAQTGGAGGFRQGGGGGGSRGQGGRRGPGGPGGPGSVNSNGVPAGAEGGEGSGRRGANKKGKGGRGGREGREGREGGSQHGGGEGTAAQQPPINMADFPELDGGRKKEGGSPTPDEGNRHEGGVVRVSAASIVANGVSSPPPSEDKKGGRTDSDREIIANPTKAVSESPKELNNNNDSNADSATNSPTPNDPGSKKKLSYAQMTQITAAAPKPAPEQLQQQ